MTIPTYSRAPLEWDSLARAYVERTPLESVAVETFGGLPADDYGAGLRGAAAVARQAHASIYDKFGGLPTGAIAEIESKPTYPEWHGPPGDFQVMTRPPRLARTIHDLVNYPGFVYVGSPYSKYRDGHSAAAGEVSIVAGALMRMGLVVYAPISHGHFISMHDSRIPQTWEFWKRQCQPMIDAASALVVVTMDGWEESVGLAHEIACFLTARKPVIYVDPDEAYDMAGGAEGLWKVAA